MAFENSNKHPCGSRTGGTNARICDSILGSLSQNRRYRPREKAAPPATKRPSCFHCFKKSSHKAPAANAAMNVSLNCVARPAHIPANKARYRNRLSRKRMAARLKKIPGKSPRSCTGQVWRLVIEVAISRAHNQAARTGMSALAMEITLLHKARTHSTRPDADRDRGSGKGIVPAVDKTCTSMDCTATAGTEVATGRGRSPRSAQTGARRRECRSRHNWCRSNKKGVRTGVHPPRRNP